MLRQLWHRWKAFGQKVANVPARILMTVFYFVVLPPFAGIVKMGSDPLALGGKADRAWRPRPAPPADRAMAARRQF